ncbi:MAG: hypothetical protein ABL895_03490 [Cyclobacteriaceae bacterium]
MSTREILSEEIKKTPENIDEVRTHLASEKVLSRDWDTPEEDEAWKNL